MKTRTYRQELHAEIKRNKEWPKDIVASTMLNSALDTVANGYTLVPAFYTWTKNSVYWFTAPEQFYFDIESAPRNPPTE